MTRRRRSIGERSTGGAGRREEVGDLLFVCVNLARKLGVDPESALRRCNRKFESRFRMVETLMQDEHGRTLEESELEDMEALWQRAKQLEKS
jgi:ATP diphosphatase